MQIQRFIIYAGIISKEFLLAKVVYSRRNWERNVGSSDDPMQKIGGIRLAKDPRGDSLVTWEQRGWGFQSLS